VTPTKEKDGRGEEASATVELAILLPVYMILFVAVLTIGHMVLIKQELVLAVRYQAWLPNDSQAQNTGSINNSFFPDFTNYGGAYTSGGRVLQDLDLSQEYSNELNTAMGQMSGANGGDALQLATKVLNDDPQQNGQGQRHLQKSAVMGQFTYNPDWLGPFLAQQLHQPTASCTVYTRKSGPERKFLSTQSQDQNAVTNRDPIEDYTVDSSAFAISTDQNLAFFPPSAPASQDQGATLTPQITVPQGNTSGDVGIWANSFRIGGDESSERNYFHQWLYGGGP
jgi:hypothetical protein